MSLLGVGILHRLAPLGVRVALASDSELAVTGAVGDMIPTLRLLKQDVLETLRRERATEALRGAIRWLQGERERVGDPGLAWYEERAPHAARALERARVALDQTNARYARGEVPWADVETAIQVWRQAWVDLIKAAKGEANVIV